MYKRILVSSIVLLGLNCVVGGDAQNGEATGRPGESPETDAQEAASSGDQCRDTSGYVDPKGYSCADWNGEDCTRAAEDWGYQQNEEDAVAANCRLSCGTCDGATDGATGSATAVSLGNWNVYYGYLHSHTGLSDGSGTPAQAFARARDTAKLDFFAVTEHDYYPNSMTSADWATIKQAADQYYVAGRFVTFRGFEWTSDTPEYQTNGLGLGHLTIINTDDWCSSASSSTRTLNQVVSWLSSRNGIAMFNHPGQYGTTFNKFTSNKTDKIVGMELWNRSSDYYSGNGFYSNDGGKGYYDEALSRGWYLGAGGGQDNHDADWGTANEWRIGVLSRELTRAGILGAFQARRFYSSRDRNLAVSFICNGSQMGSRIARGNANCTIETLDGDNERTTKIELVRKGTVIQTWTPNSTHPVVTHSLQTQQGDYLYARVYQGSSWTAISAPIFFN